MSDTEKDKKMSAARSAATTKLRENHREEFDRLLKAEAEARGVKWEPRKTPEQKAAEEMERLLEQFPHLREQVVAQPQYDSPTPSSAEPTAPTGQTV